MEVARSSLIRVLTRIQLSWADGKRQLNRANAADVSLMSGLC